MIDELPLGHIATRAFEFRILDRQDQFSCRASNRYYAVASNCRTTFLSHASSPESRDDIQTATLSDLRFELAVGRDGWSNRYKTCQFVNARPSERRSSYGCSASCSPTPSPVMIGSGFCSGRPCATNGNGHGTTGRRDGGATRIFCSRLLDSSLGARQTITDGNCRRVVPLLASDAQGQAPAPSAADAWARSEYRQRQTGEALRRGAGAQHASPSRADAGVGERAALASGRGRVERG